MAFSPDRCASPIARLANECIHMIYAYLTPGEAANLRLLSKNMAVIGLHYLIPTVYLELERDSFNKLWDIADHPVASKHVYELVYDVDRLQKITREDWSKRIEFAEYRALRNRVPPKHPGANASAATMQAYDRELQSYSTQRVHQYSKEQLRQEWHQFQDACIKQSAICNSRALSAKLRGALVRFPNLRSVRMSSKSTMTRWLEGFTQRLGASWDQDAVKEEWLRRDSKVGLGSTQSVLRAIRGHNLPITRLCLDSLNWQFLTQKTRDFEIAKESFRHLKHLSMSFVTHKSSLEIYTNEATAFMIKQRGRLLELLSAAPDLQTLRLSFCPDVPRPILPFGHANDMFHWKSLQAIELRRFDTTENELLEFFSRHADSLRSVTLADIDLVDGTWLTTWHRMRQTLQLKHAHAHGELDDWKENGVDMGRWRMNHTIKIWDDEREVSLVSPCLGDLIRQYLQEHDEVDMTFEDYTASIGLECLGEPWAPEISTP